jgi:hypothetical protein
MMQRKDLKDLATNIYYCQGDAICAEQIIAQARTIGRPKVVAGSSKHQLQEISLRKNALCIIDKAFRLREGEMRIKE